MYIRSIQKKLRNILLLSLAFIPLGFVTTPTYAVARELGLDLTCVTQAEKQHLLDMYQRLVGVSPFDEAGEFLIPSSIDLWELKMLLAQLYAVTDQAGQIWTWKNPDPNAILSGVQVYGNILTIYAADDEAFSAISQALDDAAKSWSFADQLHFIHQTEKDHIGIHVEFRELEETHSHMVYPTEHRQSVVNDLVLGTLVTHKLLTFDQAAEIASYMEGLEFSCRTGA